MSVPPIPPHETSRLQALHAARILDTPPEPNFDELAQLAADICATPVALITFVDRDRQWFKARVGFEPQETSREVSFCAHAICQPQQDLFEIANAEEDVRFADNPLVRGDPRIRFYAGTPLVNEAGHALGTLCVIDRKPRTLTPAQRRGLLALRRFVMGSLELRRIVSDQQAIIHDLDTTRRELDQARQAAEAATRAMGRFMATMSHEVRTPMNGVLGMSSLLATTELNGEQREYVDTIRSSGELMLAVVNDILDFSKLNSGQVQIERTAVDLPQIIAHATGLLAAEAARKRIALRTELDAALPRRILADPLRLRQVLLNVLSNAVKFTERGEVTVRTQLLATQDNEAEIEFVVTDTGIGLTAAQIGRLFTEFTQADVSTTRRFGGTGLGLVISKRLVELHGGRIWVESQPGAGSQFHFTIKGTVTTAPAAATSAIAFDATFATRHPARILLADDNTVNQRVATRILQKLGYEPTVVASGEAVLRLLGDEHFDVILMDVEMPEMDGVTATRRLRDEVPPARQPKVIALTAHALAEDRARFLAAGMDAVLCKPLRVDELQAVIVAQTK